MTQLVDEPSSTQSDGETSTRDILLDNLPCIAMILKKETREIVFSNKAARKIGAVPGKTCHETFAHLDDPCPHCLAPKLWDTNETQQSEVERGGIHYEDMWMPLTGDLYVHYIFDITERKRTEENLKKQRMLYEDLVETSQNLIFKADTGGRFTFLNKAWETLIGYRRDEMIGRPFSEFKKPDVVLRDLRTFQRILAGEPARNYETSYLTKEREEKFLVFNVQLLRDVSGKIIGTQGTAYDVTETRKVEESLRDSEEKYRQIMATSKDAILLLDFETRQFIDVNKAAEDLYGFSRDEFLNMKNEDIAAELDDSENFIRETVAGRTIKLPVLYHKKKNGSVFPAEISGTSFSHKGRTMVCKTVRDISDRRKAEEQMRDMARFPAEDPNPVLRVAKDGIVLYYNEAGRVLMNGWHCKLGERIPERYRKIIRKTFDSRQTTVEEIAIEERLFSFVITPVEGTDYVNLYGRDITHHRHAERMESLGVLASGIAHDLNNVLLPAIMLPDIIQPYLDRPADQFDEHRDQIIEWNREIKVAAKRATSVIRDLVTMGRRERYDIEPLDINQVIRDNMISYEHDPAKQSESRISVIDRLSRAKLFMRGSEPHLSRIIFNLTKNAVEAINGRGKVVIKTSKQHLAGPLKGHETVPPGDYVLLEVSDTGTGIAGKDMSRIFEPFFTRKPAKEKSGSGLGLSVVHGLVKDHGGYIDLESTPGKGTTFRLYFPASKETQRPKPDTAKIDRNQMRGTERVLIVDDEELVLTTTCTALRRFGYDVTTVSTGNEAVTLFKAAKKAEERSPFDVLITDMVMEDMDGLATYGRILEMYPDQKAIISSGYTSEEKTAKAENMGADWLAKPYGPGELGKAVRDCLERGEVR